MEGQNNVYIRIDENLNDEVVDIAKENSISVRRQTNILLNNYLKTKNLNFTSELNNINYLIDDYLNTLMLLFEFDCPTQEIFENNFLLYYLDFKNSIVELLSEFYTFTNDIETSQKNLKNYRLNNITKSNISKLKRLAESYNISLNEFIKIILKRQIELLRLEKHVKSLIENHQKEMANLI